VGQVGQWRLRPAALLLLQRGGGVVVVMVSLGFTWSHLAAMPCLGRRIAANLPGKFTTSENQGIVCCAINHATLPPLACHTRALTTTSIIVVHYPASKLHPPPLLLLQRHSARTTMAARCLPSTNTHPSTTTPSVDC